MTDEQILQLAENHLTFEKWEGRFWKADTLQLLKFAALIYTEGFKVGYDEGWESSNVSTKMNTWSSDDD